MKILVVAWTAMLSVFLATTALGADIEVVVDKSALGPGLFAADEIRREATARGIDLANDLQNESC